MRKIIHCDCDCFYAAVEMRDHPEYRSIPLAIGGSAERRGVIATCNYLARGYGVRSAMATARALTLCPGLTVIRGDMAKYRAVSQQIMGIFRQVTPVIEPLSLDEAYLDVSNVTLLQGSATRIAAMLKQQVLAQTGITISAGVAPNKFLAKIASDWQKPDGLFVIRPDQVDAFVRQLPVAKLHGVGRKTAQRLQQMGVYTCADLRLLSQQQLIDRFGRFGRRLYQLSRGEDERPVSDQRIRKSISVEHTFATDLPDLAACQAEVPALYEELQRRYTRHQDHLAVQGVVVKLKFADFTQTTVEQQLAGDQQRLFAALLVQGFQRANQPVRLLGLGYRLRERHLLPARQPGVVIPVQEQLQLWPNH